jgi:5-(carboxyamino)imidazole ribonucleotide synthase
VSRVTIPPVPAGRTIGIIGGGQLGRMTALAAAELGYRCHIYCPDPDSPAFDVAAERTVAGYDDGEALERFAAAVDVVTFEFENIPDESVRKLAERTPVRPRWECLHVAQDRLREKEFLASIGVPTTGFRRIENAGALGRVLEGMESTGVLKSARWGYDGKGQVMVGGDTAPEEAWREMGADLGILEDFVEFEREISVIVARDPQGKMRPFDPVENRHVNHILDTTLAPAPIPDRLRREAVAIAGKVTAALDLVGLLAVEMFVTADGRLLVNELAPRPHNSGHWTTDACVTSQFEQFVRAVCGLPLGSPERHSDAVMKNLLGDAIDGWRDVLDAPDAKLHLYGKKEARPGRKMGHVTTLYPRNGLPANV